MYLKRVNGLGAEQLNTNSQTIWLVMGLVNLRSSRFYRRNGREGSGRTHELALHVKRRARDSSPIDVDKSAYHQLSHDEIGGDNPVTNSYPSGNSTSGVLQPKNAVVHGVP